jgi:hypothetical protein
MEYRRINGILINAIDREKMTKALIEAHKMTKQQAEDATIEKLVKYYEKLIGRQLPEGSIG